LYFLRTVPVFILLLLQSFFCKGQVPQADSTLSDSVSISGIPSDSLYLTDTLANKTPNSDIESVINYTARDSIRFDVATRNIFLFGDADIDYGTIDLKSEQIEIDWNSNLVTATGIRDSTGKLIGKPVFKDKTDEFQADTINYNISTKRGLIIAAVTQEGEGFIRGSKGLKDPDNNVYFKHAIYTTCNLEHPHFYIGANKLKVIPDDKVISGPFNLWISDIPTPLGFIFGFFPLPEKHKSGILFPSNFGEHNRRGFYFTDGGYYIALGDYAGIAARGDLYSNGSWRAGISSDYRKRYRYNGNVYYNYSKLFDGFIDTPEERKSVPEQQNFTWRHNTETKGLSRFNANVNISSSSYYQLNSYNPQSILTASINSNVIYSTSFRNTPFNLTTSASVDQNLVTNVATITLPDINFSMNRIYPFKKKTGISKNNWTEKLFMNYGLNTKLQTTNIPTSLSLLRERNLADSIPWDTLNFKGQDFERLINRAQYGAQHNFAFGTTLKAKKSFLKHFSFNPNANYTEFWYPDRLKYHDTTGVLETDIERGFKRTNSYNAGISTTTWLYGTYRLKSKKVSAVRHSVSPTLSYSYQPDFSKNKNNFFEHTDSSGRELLNRFNGFIYGSPGVGERSNLTFSLNNILEAKLFTKDTSEPSKKIKLLDQLNFNGTYNFAADSFNLSNINITAVTRLFGIFDIRYNASIDPYYWKLDLDSTNFENNTLKIHQTRVNESALSNKAGIGTLASSNLSVGASLNPQVIKSKFQPKEKTVAPEEVQPIIGNYHQYVDFNLPWNLQINYIISRNKLGHQSAYINHTIQFNGDIKLAENWKFGFNSAYDIKNKGLSVTRIEIYRDLHCWQMSLSAVLFSNQQSYMFTISPKAGILQDLKLNKRSPGSFGQSPRF
jgi:hypothetical protein